MSVIVPRALPTVLSLIAGSSDAIGFLGLGGLFIAHVTGNLVILTAHLVHGDPAHPAEILALPVFMSVLCLTRVLAEALDTLRFDTLGSLLMLQLGFLTVFFVLCVAIGPHGLPYAPLATIAGMFGVAAMAVQNALVQFSLKGTPPTAVMTTNITRFTMDVGTMLLRRSLEDSMSARKRVEKTWPTMVGFAVGCGIGALGQAVLGFLAVALPVSLALVAVGLGFLQKSGARAAG